MVANFSSTDIKHRQGHGGMFENLNLAKDSINRCHHCAYSSSHKVRLRDEGLNTSS
jgi:hypothetical protein